SELGGLTCLQTLRLESDQLTGAIPSELGGLTCLQTLRLESNQLTGKRFGEGYRNVLDQQQIWRTWKGFGLLPSHRLQARSNFQRDGSQSSFHSSPAMVR
ncbi:unnamed protein product, partial [Ectocarpus sp. 4 AP-2014]